MWFQLKLQVQAQGPNSSHGSPPASPQISSPIKSSAGGSASSEGIGVVGGGVVGASSFAIRVGVGVGGWGGRYSMDDWTVFAVLSLTNNKFKKRSSDVDVMI